MLKEAYDLTTVFLCVKF